MLTYVSTAAERLLGYEPEALIGTPFSDVVGDSSTEQVLDLYRRVMRGETVESAEFELTAADGTSKTFEINA